MPEISLMDYRDADVIEKITSNNVQQVKNDRQGYGNEVEPDVVGLASSSEDVALPLLNCVSGLIGHRDDHMVVPDEEYFEGIKQSFIKMEQLPENESELLNEDWSFGDEMSKLREIYSRHGWPNAFNKEECVKEVIDSYENRDREQLRRTTLCCNESSCFLESLSARYNERIAKPTYQSYFDFQTPPRYTGESHRLFQVFIPVFFPLLFSFVFLQLYHVYRLVCNEVRRRSSLDLHDPRDP